MSIIQKESALPPSIHAAAIFRIFRYLLAGCLIFASVAKIQYAVSGWSTNPQFFEIAIAIFELILGVWIVGQIRRFQMWLVILFFGTGCVLNLYKWNVGNENCSCLGAISILPLYMAGFDAIVLGLTIYFSRIWLAAAGKKTESIFRWVLPTISFAVVVSIVMVLVGEYQSTGLSDLIGEGNLKFKTSIEPIVFEDPSAVKNGAGQVIVFNPSFFEDVKIVGYSTTCPSYSLTNLPITVPARGQAVLDFNYRIPPVERKILNEVSNNRTEEIEQQFEIQLIDDRQSVNGKFSFRVIVPKSIQF